MTEISIRQAQLATSPNPFALLMTDAGGRANAMAISWWSYASNRPPMLTAALSNKGFSGGLIRKNGCFSLCLVDDSLRDTALKCGHSSGRDHDKITELGLRVSWIDGIPVAEAAAMVLLCRLTSTAEAGDHTVYVAEVERILEAESHGALLHCVNGYAELK